MEIDLFGVCLGLVTGAGDAVLALSKLVKAGRLDCMGVSVASGESGAITMGALMLAPLVDVVDTVAI